MLRPVWPGLKFWYILGVISSPSWFFSLLSMDFFKKTSGFVFTFLISALVLLWSAGNFVVSKLYFSLRRNPKTVRFFRDYQRAGKIFGYALLYFGNVGLYYFSEKSVASILTFLFLALYCLCTLFCIQPYTDFGTIEFLLGASMNQTLSLFGLRSSYSWLVIIACIVIGGIRYILEPAHPPGSGGTSDEDQLDSGQLLPITSKKEDPPPPSVLKGKASGGVLRLRLKKDFVFLVPKRLKKIKVLGGLVPGSRKRTLPVLVKESVDYIAALEFEVTCLQALAELVAPSSL
ncbi:hypothetical protein C3L33_04680, partial [Rhododendron williamsianum]